MRSGRVVLICSPAAHMRRNASERLRMKTIQKMQRDLYTSQEKPKQKIRFKNKKKLTLRSRTTQA